MKTLALCVVNAVILLNVPGAQCATWYVPSQCPTIKTGIDSASAGDTVLVACGTYYEHDIVMKSGVCLRSQTGAAECVSIDAGSQGRILLCKDASDTVRVEGITLTRGSAERGGAVYCRNSVIEITNCGLSDNLAFSAVAGSGYGGAVYCDSCFAAFTRCVFLANLASSYEEKAGWGGAVHSSSSILVLIECTLTDNLAYGWYPDAGLGGALYAAGSSLVLSGCAVLGNEGVHGGGVYCEGDCSAILTGCTLSENSANGYDVLDGFGGGLASLGGESSALLVNCDFLDNQAAEGGGMYGTGTLTDCRFSSNRAHVGGGIFGSGTLQGCVFRNNRGTFGGAVCGFGDSSRVTNCTFHGNSASDQGAALYGATRLPWIENSIIASSDNGEPVYCWRCTSDFTLVCCNIWGNGEGDWVGSIAGREGLNGNFSTDPLFCNPDSGDFHLDEDSPCAPGNAGACDLIGALDVGCSTIAPELTLGVFQNPHLTQYLDIYLVSSEQLDSTSVTLTVGSDTIGMRCLDDTEYVWAGDHELTGSADSVSIEACASDVSGNDTCARLEFSASLVTAAGGEATSADGKLQVTISPGILEQDVFVLILPGESALFDPPKPESALQGTHAPVLADADTQLPWYRVSPRGLLSGSPALLEFSYAGTSLEDGPPDRLVIECAESGALESFADPERQMVSAAIRELGTFRLAVGSEGSSRLVEPRFLLLRSSFPNPFANSATIRFEIRSIQHTDVSIYDVSGRRVARLLNQVLYPGSHEIIWDGMQERGEQAAPGVYFCRVQAGALTSTTKVLLVR